MSALPPTPAPVPTTITTASIMAILLPMIESALVPVIDAALAQAGPIGPAVAACMATMIPMLLSAIQQPETAAQAALIAQAAATLDAAIAAEKAAGA
jgi:hypothetical protein